jgi:hypothetical protein
VGGERRRKLHDILEDEEPLRIGAIGSPEEASRLGLLFPEARWFCYRSVEQFSWWGELDEVDVLVVDVGFLEGGGAIERTRGGGVLGHGPLESLGDRVALVLLLAPEPGPPDARHLPAGFVVLAKSAVVTTVFRAVVAAYAERIRIERCRRLFHEVAAAFTRDARD